VGNVSFHGTKVLSIQFVIP